MTTTTIHPIAQAAVWAARNWDRIGPYAAYRYAAKRGALPYLTIARVLACAERAGIK
jgi:hypothetical protein